MTMCASSTRTRTVPAAAALLGVAAAWAAIVAGAGHVSHDEVLGSGHMPDPAALVALLGGWQVMVVAMMLPPEIAAAGGAVGRSARWGWAVPSALVAAMGAVWTGFAIMALTGDAVLHRLVHSWPWLAGLIAPLVFAGAGVFQHSALRKRLLERARDPSRPPWRHALCCLGSCWALMLVMFAIGMGNLLWMGALTAVMTVERAARPGPERLAGTLLGWALIGAGALVAIQPGLIG
jgi:predicted metal-binding membrane protein